MADGAAYLEASKVQEAIASAVTQILKSRPADPITAIGQLLIAAGKASAGLRKFPTTPVVQVGFTKAIPVSQLLEVRTPSQPCERARGAASEGARRDRH
jgi:hypothetical protein